MTPTQTDLRALKRGPRPVDHPAAPSHAASGGTVVIARPKARWATRLLVPAAVLLATGGLLAYAARDALRPRLAVYVAAAIPKESVGGVTAAKSAEASPQPPADAPLGPVAVQAPGWIEPAPYAVSVPALAEGDAVAGKTVFKKCAPCHSTEPVNRVGPTLAGIVGRPVASVADYKYSARMQAFAEGFALMKDKSGFNLDLAEITELWRHGSVVRSWLLDLSADFLAEDQMFDDIAPFVADSGEGRWTALASIEQGIPAPVIMLSLMMRFTTQGRNDYAAKMLAKMRHGFGGHAIKKGEQ